MRPRANPCLPFIVAHLEDASGCLRFTTDVPPRHERAGECRIREVDRDRVISTPRAPDGVIAHPSAPQFSSSQAVICVYRWPRPLGGTAILMRTGKRRSAAVIISPGLPGMHVPFSFFPTSYTAAAPCPAAWACVPRPLCSLHVWPGPPLLRRELVFSIPPHRPTPNIAPSWNNRLPQAIQTSVFWR
jgi:hypothetical protein